MLVVTNLPSCNSYYVRFKIFRLGIVVTVIKLASNLLHYVCTLLNFTFIYHQYILSLKIFNCLGYRSVIFLFI